MKELKEKTDKLLKGQGFERDNNPGRGKALEDNFVYWRKLGTLMEKYSDINKEHIETTKKIYDILKGPLTKYGFEGDRRGLLFEKKLHAPLYNMQEIYKIWIIVKSQLRKFKQDEFRREENWRFFIHLLDTGVWVSLSWDLDLHDAYKVEEVWVEILTNEEISRHFHGLGP